MKKINWERLLAKVDNADTALSSAIQAIEDKLVYKGFDHGDEPTLDMGSSHELILSWHRYEMFPFTFTEIMENKGYISPDDF